MQQALDFGQVFTADRDNGMKLRAFYNTILQCLERLRQRRQLLRLDDRMLSDIGITREQAVNEARKPCWVK